MAQIIPFDACDPLLDWNDLTDAFVAGHGAPPATVEDVFLYRDNNTLLNRSAWISGMGVAVKCATVFPDNPVKGKPMIGGAVNLFSDEDGRLEAILDFHLVTKWKTAGDSLLGAKRLARPESRRILIVGAGTVGQNMKHALSAAFPQAQFTIWNRTPAGAARFAAGNPDVAVADDLEVAVRNADIITCATMSTAPLIKGAWLQPGQHIDLIGAYRPDMREVDDAALQKSSIFVDNMRTTADHIGELKIPLAAGVINRDDIRADFYKIDQMQRTDPDEITLFKNGGGAHLDLMTSRYIQKVWANQ